MGRPKKKFKDLSVTDGKLKEDEKTKFIPRTIDDVLGRTRNPYSGLDEAAYKASLLKMDKADLQMACIKFDSYPNDSRERMIETLMKKFRQHKAAMDRSLLMAGQKPGQISEKARAALAKGANHQF